MTGGGFSGTAEQVNAVFQTEMHRDVLNGKQHWANSAEISLPQALAGMALGVQHLNTFRPEPHVVKRWVHQAPQSGAASVSSHYTLQDQGGDEFNFVAP